jgi:outer membrane protein TolC
LFPNFTLNADYGFNSTSLKTLFASSAAFWTMGASVATPLVQGPTLWFQRKAAIDAYQQSLANYQQTLLAALAQVGDALDGLRHDAQTVEAESRALSAASEALNLIQANYQAGTVNYLQVLIADGQYQQAQLATSMRSASAFRTPQRCSLRSAEDGGTRRRRPYALRSLPTRTRLSHKVTSIAYIAAPDSHAGCAADPRG